MGIKNDKVIKRTDYGRVRENISVKKNVKRRKAHSNKNKIEIEYVAL